MAQVPFSGMPADWPELAPDHEAQIAQWARLVACQRAREQGDVPNVEMAWFVAGMLYERERQRKEAK